MSPGPAPAACTASPPPANRSGGWRRRHRNRRRDTPTGSPATGTTWPTSWRRDALMSEPRSVVVIGGTSGLGLEIARHFVADGASVVLSGRDAGRAKEVAASLGGVARGVGFDLAEPGSIGAALADVERCDALVLAAIERDTNSVASYDILRAARLVTLKLVGYTEVVH